MSENGISEKDRGDAVRAGRGAFLKDVLICSLGAYGGPEDHVGGFMDQMVAKKR